jgi:homoserine kinase
MPSGSGLGSSAASAAAGAYAVNKLFNGGLSEDELILAAMKGEAYVSGGYFADNVAPSILGGATLTQSIDPLKVSKLGTIDELILVLIIPNIQILTKDSRDVIPNKIDKRNFITNMANTASITAAFCKNDYALLKDNLIDVIFEPARTKLIPGLADIKLAAVKAGADGCTISGSGPAIFAISNSHQRAKKIKYEMEKEFINHGVECTGFITTPSKVGSREVTME